MAVMKIFLMMLAAVLAISSLSSGLTTEDPFGYDYDDELDYGTFPTHLVHIPEDVGVERPWSDEENPSSDVSLMDAHESSTPQSSSTANLSPLRLVYTLVALFMLAY
ncbi:hypothetical protein E3U43_006335 [Larimichthys crocea]|nr:hypothetical protein E3U43_006335 [Larimichthys crocea]